MHVMKPVNALGSFATSVTRGFRERTRMLLLISSLAGAFIAAIACQPALAAKVWDSNNLGTVVYQKDIGKWAIWTFGNDPDHPEGKIYIQGLAGVDKGLGFYSGYWIRFKGNECDSPLTTLEGTQSRNFGVFNIRFLDPNSPSRWTAQLGKCNEAPSNKVSGTPRSAPGQKAANPATAVKSDTISVSPRVIPVGKWPEGIGWDGNDLWVAESGQRRIAQIDVASGRVVRQVKVGRLPVGIYSSSGGSIYTVVATDKKIWEQPARARGHVFGHLPDYPSAVAGDDSALYILGWVGGRNDRIRVTRFDRSTGRRARSGILMRNGQDIAVGGGSVWTVHTPNPGESEILMFDPSSLRQLGRTTVDGFLRKLAAGDQGVFAGGSQQGSGVVVKFDPKTGEEVGHTVLESAPVLDLVLDNDFVLAVDRYGVISVLNASNLALLRTIRMDFDFGDGYPKAMLPFGSSLAITTQHGRGENGSLLIIADWRP